MSLLTGEPTHTPHTRQGIVIGASRTPGGPTSGGLFLQQIEARVRANTNNRIQGLVVEEVDGRVVVRGRAPTQYAKQLALHAALELLTGERFREQIVVGTGGCSKMAAGPMSLGS